MFGTRYAIWRVAGRQSSLHLGRSHFGCMMCMMCVKSLARDFDQAVSATCWRGPYLPGNHCYAVQNRFKITPNWHVWPFNLTLSCWIYWRKGKIVFTFLSFMNIARAIEILPVETGESINQSINQSFPYAGSETLLGLNALIIHFIMLL